MIRNVLMFLFIPDDVFHVAKYRPLEERNVVPKAIVKDSPYWICTGPGSNEMCTTMCPVQFDAGCNEFKLLPSYTFGEKKIEFVNMGDSLTIGIRTNLYSYLCPCIFFEGGERLG